MVLSFPMLYNLLNLTIIIGTILGIPYIIFIMYKRTIRLNRRLERIERDMKILALEKEIAITKLRNSLKP
ncbi:hypothetical protein [Fusibacter bizertensis]